MTQPANIETIWLKIINGKATVELEFLAARILQGSLIRSFNQRPTTDRLERCARELRELFLQNVDLPAARNDLQRILARERRHGH